MKHKRFEENILIDEAYTNYGRVDKNADDKKSHGIAKHFAETLEYDEKKKWFHQLPQEPMPTKSVSQDQIEELKKEANSALHGDTLAYETKNSRSGSSDHQWAKTLLNKGAIGDRVAAATILIQDNPLYNLNALRNLISNVKPAKKRDGIIIIDALSELLVSELLIPDVKLRTFQQHSLGHVDDMSSGNKHSRRNILKLWYYEDQLKELYGSYVEALNKFGHDSVEANKEKAVSSMSYLLMHHPEREKMLLTYIINKLGDPSQAVASKVIYHLCQLLYNHPNMKSVVLSEIEKMLFRTNISTRAQYYGVCFLNQFFLGKDDSVIAENLIRIYFSFFRASIKKGDIDSRLMSAILTGVKRAYPFADGARLVDTSRHMHAIHRLVHLAGIGVAIRALALLLQVSGASQLAEDRYYTALYKKLTNADILTTTHSALLYSLVYKSLKRDTNVSRTTAFVKRLLQLCCLVPPAQACGLLYLVSQVLRDGKKRDAVRLEWTKTEPKEAKEESEVTNVDLNDTNEPAVHDEGDEKSEPSDVEDEVKVEQNRVDLLKGTKQDLLNDDEEETYVDLKIDDEGNVKPKKRKRSSAVAGWFHAKVKSESNADNEIEEVKVEDDVKPLDKKLSTKIQMKKTINMDKVITTYDPSARNPSYAGGECSAYVELTLLATHYHPTVKLFAEKILNNQIIQYSGDPLIDFSGVRFLDRFVFKNPKKRSEVPQDEDGLKKVRGSHPKFALRKNYSAKGLRSIPVNSSTYLNEDSQRIPVDERFLYDFLQKRRVVRDPDDSDDSDGDSVTSEDFEKYLDSVTGGPKPDELEEDLDFLAEMETSQKEQSTKRKGRADDEDEQNDELGDDEDDLDDVPLDSVDEDGSDGELNISGDDDEPAGLSADEDELLLEGSDEDDQIEAPGAKGGKNKLKLKLKGKDDLGSLFASAEEFSTLLEDTATSKGQGSSQAVANTDNSSTKQLAWEESRDRWIKGYNKRVLGNKKGNFKSKNKKIEKNKMADGKGKAAGGKRKGGKNIGGAGSKKRKVK